MNKNSGRGTIYYTCIHKHCDLNLKIGHDQYFIDDGLHNHTDDYALIYKLQLKSLIKMKIWQNRFIGATDAYNEARRELNDIYGRELIIIGSFPSFDSMKSVIYRYITQTKPSTVLSAISLNIYDLNLPNGTNMLLYSYFSSEKMIILGDIFSSQDFVDLKSKIDNR
ncbi:hypothetical protein DMUE_5059 [Dictyocoela muelleri]|nr:hypothetical protein DMUE_5059 [Dictyocoela muelleri]